MNLRKVYSHLTTISPTGFVLRISKATALLLVPVPARLMAGRRVSVCKKRVILLLTDSSKSSSMADLSTLIKQIAPRGRTWRCSLFLSTWACNYSTPVCTVGSLGNGMQVAVSPSHPCLQMHWRGKGFLLLRKFEREPERVLIMEVLCPGACLWIQDRPFMYSGSKPAHFTKSPLRSGMFQTHQHHLLC